MRKVKKQTVAIIEMGNETCCGLNCKNTKVKPTPEGEGFKYTMFCKTFKSDLIFDHNHGCIRCNACMNAPVLKELNDKYSILSSHNQRAIVIAA